MIPIVTKFTTTTTTDYDLIANVVWSKLYALNLIPSNLIGEGLQLDVTVKVGAATQIKVNARDFYDDFIDDTTWSTNGPQTIKSLIIKDTAISGTITIR